MQIRNFSIIAHIDHGKTTLTDRLLQTTKTIAERDMTERVMDSNPIEQERGITITLAPVRMQWHDLCGEPVELNLIDTPGHVDFSYEVSRSLAACEGVLLVVDATQGVQAQTLANYEKAAALGLKVLPVINKIDLPAADPDSVALELIETFNLPESDIVRVSAKTGQNIEALLDAVVAKIPPPTGRIEDPLRALVFTSLYDQHQGVIAYVRVVSGVMKREQLSTFVTRQRFTPTGLGYFAPQRVPTDHLSAGEVGFIATGLKDIGLVSVGDTIARPSEVEKVKPLPGYKEPQPMVYLELYPVDGDEFVLLQEALLKLKLHDAALQFTGTHSRALGNGLRVGFLGILHAEIVQERLEREFNLDLVATSPSVPYEITLTDGRDIEIHHAGELPDPSQVRQLREPMTKSTLFTPREYLGAVMQLCEDHRGRMREVVDIGTRVKLIYDLPLAELIVRFHDQLKSVSSGFASLEYEVIGYEPVTAVKLSILVHHEEVEALSQIVVREQAESIGKAIVHKLKEVIPKQQFEIPLQAAIGGKIIARETVSSYRKDVTAKLYGGDNTRRMKLLEKQKRGKKRMKEIGKVQLPQEAFLAVLER
jgi:GTP-binding protein LepA